MGASNVHLYFTGLCMFHLTYDIVGTIGKKGALTALTKSLASALSRDQNAPLMRAQKHTLTLARPVKRNFGFRTTFHILFVLAFGENASFDLKLFPILAIWQF